MCEFVYFYLYIFDEIGVLRLCSVRFYLFVVKEMKKWSCDLKGNVKFVMGIYLVVKIKCC